MNRRQFKKNVWSQKRRMICLPNHDRIQYKIGLSEMYSLLSLVFYFPYCIRSFLHIATLVHVMAFDPLWMIFAYSEFLTWYQSFRLALARCNSIIDPCLLPGCRQSFRLPPSPHRPLLISFFLPRNRGNIGASRSCCRFPAVAIPVCA
jgi:hypothetical protein